MKQNPVVYLIGLVMMLIACSSGNLRTIGVRPSPTPTFIPVSYATATATPSPTRTPTAEPTESATPSPNPTSNAPTTAAAATDEAEAGGSPTPAATATATAPPLPGATPADPTATRPAPPAPLAGRIAFPVDDGGGFYDVWVVELPGGEPFLVQPHARQPNFSNDGRLLVKTQGGDRGESIGLLDANHAWQGIVNESPEDSYPFWQPEGRGYSYSNSNLVKDPDTAHLAPFIFTACSLQIPRFENSEKCQDTRRWGKIEVGEAPVWTEDDRIAFFSYKGDDGIYVVENASVLREAGGVAPSRLLVRSNGRPTDTAGFQLFFSAGDIDGNWEAYAIDLDGANLTNLSNSPLTQDGLPAVSPDGDWVAFVSDRDGHWGVWVVPRAGGEPMMVVDISKINTNPNPWGAGDRAWMAERISWGP